ncbi:hypothetical protein [Lactobacillus delbrueckii]|uniref:hypothetical protein n=1 Tax=Lactobacillus delbrueckii TaxID=1584 RepID=UPI001E425953|nr:hypothetical protein [Lactobacillus delbrueckii]
MASKVTALLKQLLGAVIVVTVPRLACLYGQKGGEFLQKLARQEKAALLADLSGLLLFGEKVGPTLIQREKAGQQFAGLSLCLLGLPSCFG